MNLWIIIGAAINILQALGIQELVAEGRFPSILVPIYWASFLTVIIGAILVSLRKSNLGMVIVYIASIPFLPLGLLVAIGARKIADAHAMEDFQVKNRDQ